MKGAVIKRMVFDASVAVAWCFEDESSDFTDGVLDSVARQQNLTAYDAAYVELALRAALPLATLDSRLRQNTPGFANAQRQRKKVEALFAELKNQIGLRRLRLRRLKFVREQFFLAAAAQNIKRLVRFLSQPTTPMLTATT